MPDQLTVTADDPTAAPRAGAGRRAPWWPLVGQVVLVLAVFAAAGALTGVLWQWWWTPPDGVVVHHAWLQDENDLQGDFSGTGLYVLLALVGGLLVAAVLGLLVRGPEVVTLVAVLAGSLLAGWLMLRVGTALGPQDPRVLAATTAAGTHLPGRLSVTGDSPWRMFPAGALVGLVVAFLGFSSRPGAGSRAGN